MARKVSGRGMRILRREVQKAVIRKVTTSHVHRFYSLGSSATANTTTTFPLLIADDDPDFQTGGDLTTACECEQGSRITDVDLQFIVSGFTGVLTWVLYRAQENSYPTTATLAALLNNDKTADKLLLRKNALKAGLVFLTAEKDQGKQIIRIRRSALKRAGKLADLDRLLIAFVNHDPSENATIYAWGTITTRTS